MSGGQSIRLSVRDRAFIGNIELPIFSMMRVYQPGSKPRGFRNFKRKTGRFLDDLFHGYLGIPARGVLTVATRRKSLAPFVFDAYQPAYLAFAGQYLNGGYEPAETLFLEVALRRSKCFYDTGSNWGYFTLQAATHPDFRGGIYTFDVSEEMNSALDSMKSQLSLEGVTVMFCGASDQSGNVELSSPRAAHLIKIIAVGADGGAKVVALDESNLPPPDLMKIDVEDHEEQVFRGAVRILAEHRPLILFEYRVGDAPAFLERNGYTIYALGLRPHEKENLEITPITASDLMDGSTSNLVAVPNGHEARWFG